MEKSKNIHIKSIHQSTPDEQQVETDFHIAEEEETDLTPLIEKWADLIIDMYRKEKYDGPNDAA
jgi:hypothetical protein